MALDEVYRRLQGWIVARDYRGYDPYDGLHTRYPVLLRGRRLRLVQTYLHKFSPVNLRPLFGVRPSLDNQAAGVLVQAAHAYPAASGAVDVERLVRHLTANTLKDVVGWHCWNGHAFPVQMRGELQTPDVPGVIGTSACASALLDHLEAHPARTELEPFVLEARRFFLDVLFTRTGGADFFRYKPITPPHSCTYNASAVAAEYVARVNARFGLADEEEKVARAFAYLVSRQRPDGAWNYSVDLRTGREKEQIDYHQGYVLDALLAYQRLGGAPAGDAYARGLEFYRTRQFDARGRGLYRYPRRWPVNIQNQAQGIVTFTRAGREHVALADRVAGWTVAHMRSRDGGFHYLRYPGFSNRIPYLRWSNASMAYALAVRLAAAAPPG